jgi:hypothetical protein
MRVVCCAIAANGIATAPPTPAMNSRRFMFTPGSEAAILMAQPVMLKGVDVRFGSKADISSDRTDVAHAAVRDREGLKGPGTTSFDFHQARRAELLARALSCASVRGCGGYRVVVVLS